MGYGVIIQLIFCFKHPPKWCGVAQWVARLTRNVEVVGLSHIEDPCCFFSKKLYPLLLRTGWFQERIWAWFHKSN